jgi:hypothetical protein
MDIRYLFDEQASEGAADIRAVAWLDVQRTEKQNANAGVSALSGEI